MAVLKSPRRVVAIDFDGTLTMGPGDEPRYAMLRFAQRCFDAGDFIVVYTARPDDDYESLKKWLKKHKVRFDALVTGKLRYDLLVDDRAVRPEEVEV